MTEILCLFLVGIATGTLAGLLGIGGGVILVPALLFMFNHFHLANGDVMHLVVGTSLSCIVFSSFMSARGHSKNYNVHWPVVKNLAPGIATGCFTGAYLSHYFTSDALKGVLALFLFYIGMRMIRAKAPTPERTLPSLPVLFVVAFIVGAKSGLLGIGGGALLIPWLTRCNVPMRKASGTSACASFIIAVCGALMYAMTANVITTHSPYTIGCIYWPATLMVAPGILLATPTGVRLSTKADTKTLKRLFGGFLFIVASRMIISLLLS